MFMENLKETINNEKSVTENGALGYRTTGKKLLDLNFSVSTLRNLKDNEVIKRFEQAFYENKMLAVKWLFFASDVREGIGERRLLRVILKSMAQEQKEILKAIIELVPEYSRYDNLWVLLDTDLKQDVINLVSKQLEKDIQDMRNNKSISLLAKWMPSANTSSKKTRYYAHIFIDSFGITERKYRKMLSELRSYLDVVEVKMSSKRWDAVIYENVPSRANLIYNNAFLRNDKERRISFLGALKKNETKINASVLFPHDIVQKYISSSYRIYLNEYDETIEQLWKNLPNYIQENNNTICVCDGSGSMSSRICNTDISARTVATAISIYFAEKCSGQYKDKFITFSENPKFIDLSEGKSLREKIKTSLLYNEIANTNIEAVFDLILKTAVEHNLKQEELPKNILILSDMEFDGCAVSNKKYLYKESDVLFDVIRNRFEEKGYEMPRLIFWNILSRTGVIPIKENKLGVSLVSGFSPVIMKMVLSNETDPYKCLLGQLNQERYKPVEEAIRNLV